MPASAQATDRIVAVIVTYECDGAALARLLAALAGQVDRAIVVDNGSSRWRDVAAPPVALEVVRLGANRGLAAAQNIGIHKALAAGASHVLLLDQDSLPAPGMVAALRAASADAVRSGLNVGAAGPATVDAAGHFEGFVRFAHGRYEAVAPVPGQPWLACDLLISSGSLIPAPVLERIGDMAERFFIDKIDTEWCLRAAAAGYALLGVPAAVLHHRLGERTSRLWFGRWRLLPQHKPFRYYYMVRNSLLLRRLPHASAAWRRADRRQLRSILLYFGLLAPGRRAVLRMMLRGWWDGMRGMAGPLP